MGKTCTENCTTQKFLYNADKYENEVVLENEKCKCALCSEETEESVKISKVVSGNFTNFEYFNGSRLCKYCANLFKNSKAPNMRRSSFVAYEDEVNYFGNSELYNKLFEEKKVPFVFCVTFSFKKLNSFRAELNYNNDEYYIRQEDNLILFKTKEYKKIFMLMIKLYFDNFTKKEIETSAYNKANIEKFGLSKFLQIENEIKKYRNLDVFKLLIAALPAEKRKDYLKNKKEEETKNAVDRKGKESSKTTVPSVEKHRFFQNELW